MVSVTVEDNGIGISAESKLLLFKLFSKLQNSAVGSTGLGLYSLSKRTEAIGEVMKAQAEFNVSSISSF